MQMAKELYRSDVYIQQQKSTLAQYLASLDSTDSSSDTSTATTPVAGDAEKLAAIIKDGYILGKKDAKITIIEYSDFLCPYCKRHYNAQTIENLIKKYPNDVNMVFRQMPLQQLHPTAPLGAQWAVCVWKLAGDKAFYKYLALAFAADEFTTDNVTDMAVSLGIKKSAFTSCLSSQETIATVNAQIQEGQWFGISGTPGNLVVDNQKGTYTVIAGAYPAETFEKEIDAILGK